MTDRNKVRDAMSQFRIYQEEAAGQRDKLSARPIGALKTVESVVLGTGGGMSRIVADSATWTTEDEILAENSVAAAVAKFIGAVVLILLGIAMTVWLVGKIFY